MLTAIVHQVMEQLIRLSISDDAIELSELLEDAEDEQENEENEENEEKLIENEDIEFQDFDFLRDNTILGSPNQRALLDFYKKIPVPPPELV